MESARRTAWIKAGKPRVHRVDYAAAQQAPLPATPIVVSNDAMAPTSVAELPGKTTPLEQWPLRLLEAAARELVRRYRMNADELSKVLG